MLTRNPPAGTATKNRCMPELMKRLLLLATLATGAISMHLLYPILVLDGPGGLIYPLFSFPDTYYSSGFSHRKFLKVTTGMPASEVLTERPKRPYNLWPVPLQ